jgi:hypothetical protein
VSNQGWEELVSTASIDGTALSGTSAASIIPPISKYTLPAGFFDKVGKLLKITAVGRMSNIVTTPGTFTPDVRLGGVIAFNAGAISLNAVAKTNVSFWLEILLTCRAIGSGTAANIIGQARFTSESVVSSAAGLPNTVLAPASAPAVGTGFDSTTSLTVDLFGTFSLTGNGLTVHQYMLEACN